jgi:hypothetical protein
LGFAWWLPWRRFSTPIKVGGGKVCNLGKPAWLAAGVVQGHGFLPSSISGGPNRNGMLDGVGLVCPSWKSPLLTQIGLNGGDTKQTKLDSYTTQVDQDYKDRDEEDLLAELAGKSTSSLQLG